MSELIYLKRQNRILKITTRTSRPDHRGITYEDAALYGFLFDNKKTYTVPCSIKLKAYLKKSHYAPSPEDLMIVAADYDERGEYPFTTSYFWITFSNGGYGRKSIKLEEAVRILKEEF